jgi:type IX secretion system PorP/SprF family membrane protein
MKKVLLGLLSIVALSAQAQDVHFTQYFTSPMTLNPANTGLVNCDYRVAGNYRSQWGSVNSKPYVTGTFSYDMALLKGKLNGDVLGVGLIGLYDQSGTGALKNSTVGFSTAYHHAFGDPQERPNVLSLGAQSYLVNKSINFSDLNFEDMYNPATGKIDRVTGENLSNKDLSYADFNAGLMWTGYINDVSTYYVGSSIYHITRPQETFLKVNNAPKINQRLSVTAGGNIQMNTNTMLLLSGLYQKQGPANELLIGAATGFILNAGHDEYTKNSTLYLGAWYRLRDAIAPYVSFEWGKHKFGINYDVTISSFNAANGGRGAMEMSYIYNGCLSRLEEKKYNFACPRF